MPRRARWIDAVIATTIVNGGQDAVTLFPGITPDELRNGTIIRTIGDLSLGSTTTAGAWGTGAVDIGLGVISQEAIGASVFPDPKTASDYPVRGWLYRKRCGVFQNGVGTQILFACEFDVRSQRKLDTGAYYMVIDNNSIRGSAFTADVFGSIRTLVLMP